MQMYVRARVHSSVYKSLNELSGALTRTQSYILIVGSLIPTLINSPAEVTRSEINCPITRTFITLITSTLCIIETG